MSEAISPIEQRPHLVPVVSVSAESSSPSTPSQLRRPRMPFNIAADPKTPLSSVQPFGDYVARVFHAKESNSSMHELIACCATLYLYRCDPETLKKLTKLWAVQSADKHEVKLKNSFYFASRESMSDISKQEDVPMSRSGSASPSGAHSLENGAALLESVSDHDRADHLLTMLQHCVTEYFNNNWHEIKRTLTINKEYKVYIMKEVLPRVLTQAKSKVPFTVERRTSSVSVSPVPGQTPPTAFASPATGASPIAELRQTVTPPGQCPLECSAAGYAAGFGDFLNDSISDLPPETHDLSSPFKVPTNLPWVGEDSLAELRHTSRTHGILLYFHALFSEPSTTTLHSLAKAYREQYQSEETKKHGIAALAVVNSASQVDLFHQYDVQWYPFIVYIPPVAAEVTAEESLLVNAHNDQHVVYPEKCIRHGKYIVEWVKNHATKPPHERKIKDWVTKVVNLENRLKYKGFRDLQSSMLMLKELQCVGDTCAVKMRDEERSDPPMFVFLGGGMAAGKTTAVTALTSSEWWQKYGSNTVVVNADEFKMRDPMFSARSSDLHERSTHYAEQLLVTAINQGRDIIFDGTMSWVPFVEQTAEMVRRAHQYKFKCGRGYKPEEGIEEYFVKQEERQTPLKMPYKIKMIAICVEPTIAVPRGILRQLTTDRGVPVGAQLRSFKLFAEGFKTFVDLCDEVTLYNNNVWIDLEKGDMPLVAAVKEGAGEDLHVIDETTFDLFMNHTNINIKATGIKDLFPRSHASIVEASDTDGFASSSAMSPNIKVLA